MANGQLDRLINVAFIEVIKVSFGCLIVLFTPFRKPIQNPGQTQQKRPEITLLA
jgi:hypothetical protein